MKKSDIEIFIETMHDYGDDWTEEQVEDVYGSKSLDEALADRKGDMNFFAGIIGTILNGRGE